MANNIPAKLNEMQAATITQLLREALRRLADAGNGQTDGEACSSLARRIEAMLTKLDVDRD